MLLLAKARLIAEKYGFDYATLGPESLEKLNKYSDVIVQTTSKGMGSNDPSIPGYQEFLQNPASLRLFPT